MRIRLEYGDDSSEIMEFEKAALCKLGNCIHDLSKWYEVLESDKYIEVLDFIANTDRDTFNAIRLKVHNEVYYIIYSSSVEASNAYNTLLRCGFLDSCKAVAWVRVGFNYDKIYIMGFNHDKGVSI